MDLHEVQAHLNEWLAEASGAFQKVPGSAVLIRYVRSSYQNDPVRSAIELVLFIFFIRYLLAPSYSTSKQNYVKLTEDVSAICLAWRGPLESPLEKQRDGC
jgi:serine palmitoyltransferase